LNPEIAAAIRNLKAPAEPKAAEKPAESDEAQERRVPAAGT